MSATSDNAPRPVTATTSPAAVPDLIRQWARRTPDAPAILAPGRGALSYGRLAAQMEETVSALRAVHVGRSDRVALVLPQGPEMAVAFLAVTAGASCAPLNPGYRAEEFEFYLTDLRAAALIVQSGIDSPARTVARARGVPVIELEPLAEAEAGIFQLHAGTSARLDPGALAGPDDVALLLHTSGTTSRPKLVPLTHANIMVSAHNIRGTLGLTEADRCLNVTPLFHIHGQIGAVLSSLVAGGSVACPSGLYAVEFFAWMDELHPTWYTAGPTAHHAIVARAAANRAIIARNPLRFTRSSAAPLPARLMTELEETFGVPVIQAYGITEAASQVASNPLPPLPRKVGSVGLAAGPEVAIMDTAGSLLPQGAAGEIVIRGPNMTSGYERNEQANRSAFTHGWFRTGDEGYLDADGYLFITGRLKELINRGGEKIAPAEVESVLMDHPAVAEAVVFAAPDPRLGEEVSAAVVLRGGSSETEGALQEFASRRLADFKVPRRVLIVKEIPKGATGKYERIGLADRLGLTAAQNEPATAAYVAPRSDTERTLVEIWSRVLGVERVGVDDDFFQLGGDSILAAQLLTRVREELSVALSFLIFSERLTVAGMAQKIEVARHAAHTSSIAPAPRDGALPLSFTEERLWFLDQLEPGNPAYNLLVYLRLTGPLDVAALERSLNEIVRRHEVLRTTFPTASGRPSRVISPTMTLDLAPTDLRALPEGDRETETLRLSSEEARRPFSLAQGPLVRSRLLRLGDREHTLLLTFHHIVFDGWSRGVFLHELATLYEAFRAGKPSPLPEIPIQCADFAYWQRQRLRGEILEEQLSYWQRQLRGAPPKLPLPTDRPRPPVQTFRGAREPFALPRELCEAIDALSRRQSVTPFMTLLAAFQTLLRHDTGQDDISVGTFNAMRDRPETEGLIGFFVNNLALRVDLSGDPSFLELLSRVREVTLGAYAHQDVPFEKLLEALNPRRDPSYTPFFQVMLVLQNTPKPALGDSSLAMAPYSAGETDRSNFDMTLWLSENADGLTGSLEYNVDLFDRDTISRMLNRYQAMLESVVGDPERRLSSLRTSTEENGHPPRTLTLDERLARLSPEKRALFERRLRGEALPPPHRGAETITRRVNRGSAALSFGQERLLFMDKLMPGRAAYNIAHAVRLRGRLNVEAMERSLGEILRRHEALRTTFATVNGQPSQVIVSPPSFSLPVVGLENLPESEREEEARRLLRAETERPFDLGRDLLLRTTLFRLGDEEHILAYVMHHIASDGWSIGVFTRELARIYEAFSAGRPSPLPELPIQYADFAEWQRQWLSGEVLERQLEYWKRQLQGVTPIQLRSDRPRPSAPAFRRGARAIALSPRLTGALKVLGQREGCTLFMTLLAAFKALLFRHTSQEDIAIGSPIANRIRAEIEGLIGFFVNTLVLRTDLSGTPTFRELLRRIREVTLGAYAHQDLPFERLVEELQPERDPSRNPLYQVAFALQNTPDPSLELSGVLVSPCPVEPTTTRLDLTLYLREHAGELGGRLVFNADLFEANTIDRMVRQFELLLEGIVAAPDQSVATLPLLTDAERCLLLGEWNRTDAPRAADLCVHELFEAQTERTPDAVALAFRDRQLRYGEVNARANRLAHYLRKRGVGPEVLVGLSVERSVEMVVGLLGILKAGGAYVPLDPASPGERLAFVAEDARISVIVTESRFRDALPPVSLVCLDSDWEIIAGEPPDNPSAGATPHNLAYVIYTSGTTGTPKGVMIQHRSLVNFTDAAGADYDIKPGDRVLQFAPLSFDTSAEEIYPCLTRGATLVLRTDEMMGSTSTFLSACENSGISVLDLPTAYWHEIAAGLRRDTAFPRSLRLVIIGGEQALPERLSAWKRHARSGVRLINTYGPTETTVVATSCDLTPASNADETAIVPIGRPIRNVRTYLLDRELQPVPIGVPGEIVIGGAGVARGYLNRPALTTEKFIADPFSGEPGGRMYRTGDLARYLPDGKIEFLGRLDHQVKVRGFRVEPGEIEAALRGYPPVREAVVVAHKEDDGRTRLFAYVVPDGAAPTDAELRAHLASKLPDYMVPAGFITLDALPLTPNGKVDRRALPAPDGARPDLSTAYVTPRTEAEELVATVWRELLGLERVGVHDNFFELGGHSLLAVRMMDRIEQVSGIELPLATLFAGATIEYLAKELVEQQPAELRSLLVPVQSAGSKPPLFFLRADYLRGGGFYCMGLARALGEDQPFYALALHGHDGGPIPETIEERAASYIRMIRTIQPEGPYFLGGFCSGGVTAFEMARQLQEHGDRVALLVLIAVSSKNACFRPLHVLVGGIGAVFGLGPATQARLFRMVRDRVIRCEQLGQYYGIWLKRLSTLPRDQRISWGCRALGRVCLDLVRFVVARSHRDEASNEDTDRAHVLLEGVKNAIASYLPRPYEGRVTLIWPREEPSERRDEPTAGWGRVATEVEIHEVPGGHETAITTHVRGLAELLRVCLVDAQAKSAERLNRNLLAG